MNIIFSDTGLPLTNNDTGLIFVGVGDKGSNTNAGGIASRLFFAAEDSSNLAWSSGVSFTGDNGSDDASVGSAGVLDGFVSMREIFDGVIRGN